MAHADEALAAHPMAGKNPGGGRAPGRETGPPARSVPSGDRPSPAGRRRRCRRRRPGRRRLAGRCPGIGRPGSGPGGGPPAPEGAAGRLGPPTGRRWTASARRRRRPILYYMKKPPRPGPPGGTPGPPGDALAASFDHQPGTAVWSRSGPSPRRRTWPTPCGRWTTALHRQTAAREARRRRRPPGCAGSCAGTRRPRPPPGRSSAPPSPGRPSRPGLRENAAREEDLRRQLHTAQGRLQALGDPLQLQAEAEETARRRGGPPAGVRRHRPGPGGPGPGQRRAPEPLLPRPGRKIRGNLYKAHAEGSIIRFLLNRDMAPSAQEAGGMLPRQAALLSQGTADQLLPGGPAGPSARWCCRRSRPPPFCWTTPLVTFDDKRLAAALDYLAELGVGAADPALYLSGPGGPLSAGGRSGQIPRYHAVR